MNSPIKDILIAFRAQQKQIDLLIAKCQALESLQLSLFSVLSVTDPDLFATLANESRNILDQLPGETVEERDLAEMIRAAFKIPKDSSPHLRLVPKATSRDDDEAPK